MADVGHVDRFGNVALDRDAADRRRRRLRLGRGCASRGPRRTGDAVYALTFADVAARATLLLYEDSSRALALAVNRGSAAEIARPRAGDREVTLRPA